MREQFFDDLAKGLDDGTISRRRALKLAGGALLAAVVPSVFPAEAQALSARKRCHRKGASFCLARTPIHLAIAQTSAPGEHCIATTIQAVFAIRT